jgi:hypothetical protein
MTYAEMIAFLSERNVDLGAYRIKGLNGSRKSLDHLYMELLNKECFLSWDDFLERVVRTSFSAKIYIETFDGKTRLIETRRDFENGEPLVQDQKYAVKETLRAGEKALNCAIRCLNEELHLYIGQGELTPLPGLIEQSWNESSVYPGIITHNHSCGFKFRVPSVFDRQGPIIKDSGTTISLEWRAVT